MLLLSILAIVGIVAAEPAQLVEGQPIVDTIRESLANYEYQVNELAEKADNMLLEHLEKK